MQVEEYWQCSWSVSTRCVAIRGLSRHGPLNTSQIHDTSSSLNLESVFTRWVVVILAGVEYAVRCVSSVGWSGCVGDVCVVRLYADLQEVDAWSLG